MPRSSTADFPILKRKSSDFSSNSKKVRFNATHRFTQEFDHDDRTLIISRLNPQETPDSVRDLLEEYGDLRYLRPGNICWEDYNSIVKNSRRPNLVITQTRYKAVFRKSEAARRCFEKLNGKQFNGKRISIHFYDHQFVNNVIFDQYDNGMYWISEKLEDEVKALDDRDFVLEVAVCIENFRVPRPDGFDYMINLRKNVNTKGYKFLPKWATITLTDKNNDNIYKTTIKFAGFEAYSESRDRVKSNRQASNEMRSKLLEIRTIDIIRAMLNCEDSQTSPFDPGFSNSVSSPFAKFKIKSSPIAVKPGSEIVQVNKNIRTAPSLKYRRCITNWRPKLRSSKNSRPITPA